MNDLCCCQKDQRRLRRYITWAHPFVRTISVKLKSVGNNKCTSMASNGMSVPAVHFKAPMPIVRKEIYANLIDNLVFAAKLFPGILVLPQDRLSYILVLDWSDLVQTCLSQALWMEFVVAVFFFLF
ncbi:hypothetical protein CKAN_01193700 [Cinnamomum micranthum f. kanehirae]|uniref:Uncharacterized protein n=1 Tax=Cinnamomum micranthum f. kanehirae TaxID=337451 RepID=A0A443NXC9_9MAGN|nr:hypothetical protein CKAN_01193700 [Cinnamomum micranthum f. kanehirae]